MQELIHLRTAPYEWWALLYQVIFDTMNYQLPMIAEGPFTYTEGFSSMMIRPKVLTQARVVEDSQTVPVLVTLGSNNEAQIQPEFMISESDKNMSVAGYTSLDNAGLDVQVEITPPGPFSAYITTIHAQNIDLPTHLYYLDARGDGRWIFGQYTQIYTNTYSLKILFEDATTKDMYQYTKQHGPLVCVVYGGGRERISCSVGPYAFHHHIIFVECGVGLYPSHRMEYRLAGTPNRWERFDGFRNIGHSTKAEFDELNRNEYRFTKVHAVSKEVHNSWMFVVSCRLGTGADRFKIGFDQYPSTKGQNSALVSEVFSQA